jgi:hypothetical protein
VRQEIAAGLVSRRVKAVIPVLLEGAQIPKPELLPPSIRALTDQNAIAVSRHDIETGCVELVLAIENKGVDRQGDPRRSKLVTAAVSLVAVVAIAAFVLTRFDRSGDGSAVTPAGEVAASGESTPQPMLGQFNVAVAEFTSSEEDEASEARLLSAQLAKRLQAAFPAGAGMDVEVRGPEEVGVIGGATPEERRRSAEQIAGQIGADVVIGGQVSFVGPSSITPSAYLNPRRLADHPELGGLYELDPIAARGSYTNSVTKENLLTGLLGTTDAMGAFIRGVSYYSVVDEDPANPGLAEERFRAALLSPVLPSSTREGAHAFLGSLGLIRGDLDQAEEGFGAAVELNDASVRGRLGLAEVRFLRSTGQRCAEGTVDLEGLEDAAAGFSALTSADLDDTPMLKARLGAVRVQRCQGQAGVAVDLDEIESTLRSVLASVGSGDDMVELEAAARAELALVVAPPVGAPDRDALRESLAESTTAAELSLRPRNQAIYRWQQAFFAAQLEDLDAAAQGLAAASAADAEFADVTVDMLVPQGSGLLVPSGVGAPASTQTGSALAATGREVGPPLALGLALLGVGTLLTVWSRRLRHPV